MRDRNQPISWEKNPNGLSERVYDNTIKYQWNGKCMLSSYFLCLAWLIKYLNVSSICLVLWWFILPHLTRAHIPGLIVTFCRALWNPFYFSPNSVLFFSKFRLFQFLFSWIPFWHFKLFKSSLRVSNKCERIQFLQFNQIEEYIY